MIAEKFRKNVENNFQESFSFPFRIENMMVEFAKLHVQEALKQASEKANTKYEELPILGEIYNIDKESILNAYPIELIT